VPRKPTIFLDAWTAAQRVDQLVTRELKSAGVWTPHYALLSMICIREPITPTALAQAMGVAPTTLSDRLAELLGLGHVRRTKNPRDGRSYLIQSTAAGRRAVDRAAPVTWRAQQGVVRHLKGQLPAIEAAIADLSRALDAALAETPKGDTAA
jgi:DNA-binding MarR family transcriptional regulator